MYIGDYPDSSAYGHADDALGPYGPAGSAGSHSSGFSDHDYGSLDRPEHAGSSAAFDPQAALSHLMDRVRMPMDNFDQDDGGGFPEFDSAGPSRSRSHTPLDRHLQHAGELANGPLPALYQPPKSFWSDGASTPDAEYFLDPVAQELASNPYDDPTPRAHGGWKGKGVDAPGWQDLESDPYHVRPTMMPDRRGAASYGDADEYPPQRQRSEPTTHGDQHLPPPPSEQLRRDALAELDQMRHAQDAQDRERLRAWENRLRCGTHRTDSANLYRQDEWDQRERQQQWQMDAQRRAQYDDYQRQIAMRNTMLPQMRSPYGLGGGMPFGGMPFGGGGMPYGGMPGMMPGMMRPTVPSCANEWEPRSSRSRSGPMHGYGAPQTAANLPPLPNGLGTAPNVPAVPLGTGFAPVVPPLAPAPLGFGISPTVNSLDVHPAGNNGRARFTDQFMDDFMAFNGKLREALGEKCVHAT